MKERPMSTLIFGILNIGLALMKMAGPLVALAMANIKLPGTASLAALKADPAFTALSNFNAWTGAALGLALLALGIGLLYLKNWARLGCIIYSVIDMVLVLVMSILIWPHTKQMMSNMPNVPPAMMQGFATIGLVFGLIIGMGYPALLIFFMTRTNVIEACQPEQSPPPSA
jgi:hypothetical protein